MLQRAWSLCKLLDQYLPDTPRESEPHDFLEIMKAYDVIGHIFLIINSDEVPSMHWHMPMHAMRYTMDQLKVWFIRPNPDIKYWILAPEHRYREFLISKNMDRYFGNCPLLVQKTLLLHQPTQLNN